MAVTKIQPTGVNSEASFTFANVTATGNVLTSNLSASGNVALSGPNVNLGNVSNLKITGGTADYVLKTDGTGNLSWTAQTGGGGGTPGGTNTQIQFNDAGSFGGNANLTFDKATSILTIIGNVVANNANLGNLATANYFSGSGNLLSNIQGANVSGAVAYATTANSVSGSNVTGAVAYATTANSVAGSNVTGAVAYATTANSVSGSNVSGEVTYAATANSVAGSNVTGAVSYATTANSVSGSNVTGAVAYATTANSVSGSNVSGEVTYAATANAVSGSNVSGQVSNALIAGTVYTNAQPNITSVGTLSSLSVSGNANIGNIALTGTIIAGTGSGGNISNVDYITANFFVGNGSLLSSITGANVTGQVSYAATANSVAGGNVSGQVSNALISGTVYTNAQPNITSVGTLSSLSVNGNALVTGNLVVDGTTTYVNTTNILVQDPIIEQGGGANGAALTTNDGKDRGIVLHYYSGATVDAFMGWDNSNAEFSFGSNVSMSGEVATFNALGNVRAGNASLGNLATASFFSGSGNLLSNIQGSNVTGAVAYATTANSVSGSNVSGEVAYAATANSVAGGNVSGTVSSATTAGTVTTNAQPNITSTGTLASLSVSGNANVGNLLTNNLLYANGTAWSLGGGSANPAGVNTEVQFNNAGAFGNSANFTFNRTSNTLFVDQVVSNISGSNITSAVAYATTANSVAGSNVSGTVSSATTATTAETVTTAAQPNITSLGTLTGLTVGPNSSIVLSGTTGYVKANSLQGLDGSQALFLGHSGVAGAIGVVTNLLVGTGGTGNLTANGTISASSNVTGNYFIGNGSTLTDIAGSNVTGQVANALVAGTVYTAAQTNITSLGTLTSLSVTGNANVGNLNTAGVISTTGNANVGNVFVAGTGVVSTTGTITGGNIAVGSGFISTTGNANVGNLLTNNLLYANGDPWSLGGGGTYGNSNVATYLASFGSNAISTTGTVTTGALRTTGLISATGNIQARGETQLWYTSYTDPDSMEIRALKIGDSGMAVRGGIKTDTLLANYQVSTLQSLGTISGSTAINLNLGTYVAATTGGSTTWSFTNVPASNAVGVVLELTNGGSAAQNWGGSVKWPSGVAPTLTTSGIDVLVFVTDDGGTNWRGVLSMADSK